MRNERKERKSVIFVKKAFLLIKTLPVFTCLYLSLLFAFGPP